jgi:hypothetical protein
MWGVTLINEEVEPRGAIVRAGNPRQEHRRLHPIKCCVPKTKCCVPAPLSVSPHLSPFNTPSRRSPGPPRVCR